MALALINWSNDLSVQVGPVDNQHKELIRLINDLNDAMLKGKSKEVTSKILDGLANYTVEHFGFEERNFAKFHYAGAAAHKSEHDAFVRKVTEFKTSYDAGKVCLSLDIMQFLKSWLIHHIQGTDRKYIPCFHEHGLK